MSRNVPVIVLFLTVAFASAEIRNKGWWNHTVFYQIYPRSFMDSDNDGRGDLKGITSKLEHFNDIGVGAIWLSPINRSPMYDFGYDISDYKEVDPIFGTLDDFKKLIEKAKRLGLKVILDLVPNHTSDEHEWFKLSVNRTGKYADYYIWHDGVKNEKTGKFDPPNNWVSVFNGSAWTYNEMRKQYYFHQFYPQQPDLNYKNPEVQKEMKDVIEYWLEFGIDGFRIDAVPHLFEGNITLNEPVLNVTGAKPTDHVSLNHILTKDQPETYELVKSWRKIVDDYADKKNEEEKVLLTEAYTSWNDTIKYYNFGSHVPFNFKFITDASGTSSPQQINNIIDRWIGLMPKTGVANWVMGNHDRSRLATRYPGRADQMIMLEMVLPGVAVTYYGEEIGMEDNTAFNYSDFRDGCRTPFQWDDSVNGGFSKSNQTWLPVHSNYKTLNLEKEKKEEDSHYKLYKKLTALRKSNVLVEGSLHTVILNDVLAIVRNNSEESLALLINFSKNNVVVDLTTLLPQSKLTKVSASSVGSGLKTNDELDSKQFTIPANASVVLHSGTSIPSCSVTIILLLTAFSYFFKS